MQEPSFDINHAIFLEKASPDPLTITEYQPLSAADALTPSTHVLLAQFNGKAVVIPTLSMVYYKVAQGVLDEVPFMMTFCVLCNFGGVFSPRVDETLLNFACYGFHQGMALLSDAQTRSWWNHITGHCLHGEKKGAVLPTLGMLTHTTVGHVNKTHPEALIVLPMFTNAEIEIASRWNDNYRGKRPEWSDGLISTLLMQDERLPRFDMGIGVWTERTARYYSVLTLNSKDNVVLDTLEGRNLIVYYDEAADFPTAFYTDASEVSPLRDGLRLNNGQTYRDGLLYDGNIVRVPERPPFQVIRWYGFSYLFPNCEIYR
jgi:hypothetical protein